MTQMRNDSERKVILTGADSCKFRSHTAEIEFPFSAVTAILYGT